MRRYGAFLIEKDVHDLQSRPIAVPADAVRDPETGRVDVGGEPVGLEIDGEVVAGFPTPSRRLEIYSRTLEEWGWPEEALPGYIRSHVHRGGMDAAKGEMVCCRPSGCHADHTRSGNAKYLAEISHRNPLWLHTEDGRRLGIATATW